MQQSRLLGKGPLESIKEVVLGRQLHLLMNAQMDI